VLDLSFCLAAPGLRQQLSPRHYTLFVSERRGAAGETPLEDVHESAFVWCAPGDMQKPQIRDVGRLVDSMYETMLKFNKQQQLPLAPLQDQSTDDFDECARRLAPVCDAMFPAGAATLEHLTRGLMSALVGAVGRQ
jgi:hypothetical protein